MLRAVLPCRDLGIGELLALETGTVLRTARAAGENVDLCIADRHIAAVELIVIENRLALRISEFSENT
jgi:flagellar motor switch/type III secretory pathway protein FliN